MDLRDEEVADQKREIVERVACQCYVDHDDTYVWGTLPEADKAPYLKQAEYWIKLLRYFELRKAAESVCKETTLWLPRTESSWVWKELTDALAALKAALKRGGESD